MNEVLPVIGGFVAGTVIYRLVAPRRRLRWSVTTSIAIGVLAAAVSGELAESFAFLLIDIPVAFVCCVGATAACAFARGARRGA
jgi:hypothetical protein